MSVVSEVRQVYLKPGDFCFGEGKLRITTLLGSCVSIVLWHPLLMHGGMCHFMMPTRNPNDAGTKLNGKYADEAMELFMLELDKRRTVPAQYTVHIYGGGNMFENASARGVNIGKQNVDAAHSLLEAYGFTPAYDHIGNFGHRKIAFDVWDGAVRLEHVDMRKNIAE